MTRELLNKMALVVKTMELIESDLDSFSATSPEVQKALPEIKQMQRKISELNGLISGEIFTLKRCGQVLEYFEQSRSTDLN